MTMTMTADDSDKGDARLPSIAIPHHYDLFYSKIDLERFTFDGTVSIELTATEEAMKHPHSIVLHALDLHFVSATLREKDASMAMTTKAEQFRYRLPSQTCEIGFEESESTPCVWKAGTSYILEIGFHGILNDQMHGLYRSSFVGLDGKYHTMATTQFEATDARRAFPCFDEPALKATFCLKLCIPGHLQCISNTPPSSIHTTYVGTTPTKTITFQTTPKMSTYLVALVVGQFDGISKTSNQIQTTVYTVPGKAEQGRFCLDTAVQCLDLYQKLFEIPYPLVKSDLLAIPDFAAGAMENWGCVTYREAKILVKPGSTSESTKRGIARTVCHELAHQWFGNLVTMEFWTQLWLKEGVARFMEFVGIDSIFPEWDAWTEFVQSVYGLAQSLDSMKSSHPVEVEVKHPDEISEIFDAISYAKGASIIRMISSYIGFQTFLDGMKLYLTRHAYGNATTSDLWRALAEKSGLPIEEIAAPWTCQMGFPILILPETHDGNIIAPRFLASGPDSMSEEDKQSKWPIPVTARVEGMEDVLGPWVINGPAGDECAVLRDKINEWTMAGKWFKLNVNQCGFYRVAYTNDQWANLSKVMDPSELMTASDRLGLISDSFAAGRAGYTSIVDSLNLIKCFGDHEVAEYAVWQELSENLSGLSSLYRSVPFYGKFKQFIGGLYSRQMKKLGWEAHPDESARTGTMRGTIISMMAISGDEEVMKEAYDRFMKYKEQPEANPLGGDLRPVIFKLALHFDEAAVLLALKEIYERSTFPEEQRDCLGVMGKVKDPSRHSEVFEYTLFSGKVRLQDVSFSLNSLSASTDSGGQACWAFLKNNYALMQSKFGSGPMWPSVVGLSCRGLRTSADADAVEAFFNEPSHPIGSAKKRLEQALEAVRTRAARLERDTKVVGDFLAAY